MLKSREELIKIIEFGNDIKKIINSWDPLDLLSFTPDDEYDTEIRTIRDIIIIDKINNTDQLSVIIKNIFEKSFGKECVLKKNIEIQIAEEVLNAYKKYNLLSVNLNKIMKKEISAEKINLYIKIKKIINNWDPLNIMKIALSNEYCYEIDIILKILDEKITILKLSNEISTIFKHSYNGVYNKKKYEEIKIAKKILNSCDN
mgnify:CR=1 FL=1